MTVIDYAKSIRDKVREVRFILFPKWGCRDRYRWMYGQNPNFNNPQTLDEIIFALMFGPYKDNPDITIRIDKIGIHDYFKNRGMEDILNPLYAVYDSPDEIDLSALPKSFVLKCNHGSSMNIFVKDKDVLDLPETRKKLSTWLRSHPERKYGEIEYLNIKPRVLCERFMEFEGGELPPDYKFYCAFGSITCVEILWNRSINGYTHAIVDEEFRIIPYPFVPGDHRGDDKVLQYYPDNWPELCDLARKLSEDLPFVRVDLYSYQGKALLGEMTFAPQGGINDFFGSEGQHDIGNKIRTCWKEHGWNLP